MGVAIKVENLSKAYQLGEIGTGTLSNDLKRWAYKVRGKENPFLKIGETNDRTTKGESDMVWSLKDLNFEIEQGDAVGIIGRNGAGKSTLLKILSRVTSPTTGSVKVKGRVASLLEVGTGFHPELTGKENIFLNGAILGMRKAEIKKHFDAIVDFAGVERYIDTPVKRYSSGMYVRLAFAVAAHLESEILIVDEVLAVGDAEFQKKCLGKMNDVSKGEGRTVLFVSHNMGSIETLCNRAMLLDKGILEYTGDTSDVIDLYSSKNNKTTKEIAENRKGLGSYRLSHFEIVSKLSNVPNHINLGDKISFKFKITGDNQFKRKNINMVIGVYNNLTEPVLRFNSQPLCLSGSDLEVTCNVEDPLLLNPGIYRVNIAIFSELGLEDYIPDTYDFQMNQVDYNLYNLTSADMKLTKILLKNSWHFTENHDRNSLR